MPVPGITHRYPDRVLFYTTHNCPVYCRHCTRKRKVSDPSSSAANKQLEDGLVTTTGHIITPNEQQLEANKLAAKLNLSEKAQKKRPNQRQRQKRRFGKS